MGPRLWWCAALALVGCGTKLNARYCDVNTPCHKPGFLFCNQATRECEATPTGMVDLSMPGEDMGPSDLSAGERPPALDLAQPDLSQPDLNQSDLSLSCTTSTTCPSAKPLCASAGPNSGQCVQCVGNADCTTATTPICNVAAGTCRPCVLHGECSSGVCDVASGSCVDASNIVYVNLRDTGGGACDDTANTGSSALPYCQITTAFTYLGAKGFIKVLPVALGSATGYNGVTLGAGAVGTSTVPVQVVGTSNTAGNGLGATSAPQINATTAGGHTLELYANAAITVNVAFDGFIFNGGANGSNVDCGSNGGTTIVSVRDSTITGGWNGVRAHACTITVAESVIKSTPTLDTLTPKGFGAYMDTGSSFTLVNNVIAANAWAGLGVAAGSSGGTFSFNTVSANGSGDNFGGAICNRAVTLDSSILYNNAHSPSTGGSQFGCTGTACTMQCTLSNVVTGTDSLTSGALPGAPVFVSASDLHLSVTTGLGANQTCCIDKLSSGPAIDIDLQPRPFNLKWDIGADEAEY
jgi:hypothetical protein